MRATIINLSKRITIPKLSPTHTSSKIIKFLTQNKTYVQSYDPIMILQCSSDLIADPADRKYDNEELLMFIETCDEGIVKGLDEGLVGSGEWLDVGTTIGIIDEEDDGDNDGDRKDQNEIKDEFLWQAYSHDENK